MARKNLLKGLMEQRAAGEDSVAPEALEDIPRGPRYTKGAIGAVSQSIAALKSRSVVDLDAEDIRSGGLTDRLETDPAAHAQLMDSLKTYGQQVPVLVRPDPADTGKFQIVFGRRRVAALRDLGLPVKALVRDLDDREAVLAQGQENTARRDLTVTERVNFARQMVEAGYDRKVIADALATDKTLISRMLSVAETVPVEVIEAIGAAPGIGRDRWLAFAKHWSQTGWDAEQGVAMVLEQGQTTSDARFDALLGWMAKHGTRTVTAASGAVAAKVTLLQAAPGQVLAKVTRGKARTKFEVEVKAAGGFDLWLEENLEEIFRDWKARHGK